MQYPAFFDQIEPLVLRDPLAELLGAFADGVMQIHYLDVVRLAGHSCPTVAGAYLMARTGMKVLYGSDMPVRGEIAVEMQQPIGEGVTGVIANVLSFITGATDKGGFHGLAGQFDRRNLLSFDRDNPAPVTLIRKDTGQRVSLVYDASFIPADPLMGALFPKVLTGKASADEAKRFGVLWQRRVEAILCDYADDPRLVVLQAEY
ncbi:FmdE family protein [Sedimenticola selenatireducens]|uniref:FmdE family protein n=1 Tax=Sedimenticola selenatireducens TaxID=191960 RepID=UPI000490C3FA|nr:FmdE family protein [Sedimenticola selenatireducens]